MMLETFRKSPGEFVFISVWAIRLMSCFVYRGAAILRRFHGPEDGYRSVRERTGEPGAHGALGRLEDKDLYKCEPEPRKEVRLFLFLIVRAIRMTSCFVHRETTSPSKRFVKRIQSQSMSRLGRRR
jgi:Na+-transporting methylmalonyl-CoA/oxaloacetate decarboxylase gamma subunit